MKYPNKIHHNCKHMEECFSFFDKTDGFGAIYKILSLISLLVKYSYEHLLPINILIIRLSILRNL